MMNIDSASLGSLALTLVLFPPLRHPHPPSLGAGEANRFNIGSCFQWRRMKKHCCVLAGPPQVRVSTQDAV